MESQYLHIMINLGIVLGLMLVFLFIIKKFKLTKLASNKFIKILNIVPVGTKEKIILLEVNNAVLLVGATANHIETLYVFNEPDADRIIDESTIEPDFSKHIAGILKKGTS